MQLVQFLRKESTDCWRTIAIMAVISGIANGVLLAVINAGSTAASQDETSIRYLVLFIIAMAVFILAKKHALTRCTIVVEYMIKQVRLRISDKIRHSELSLVENLGRGDLYTKLSQDANTISQSAFMIINAAQESIMLVFAALYLAWLSKTAFLIIAASIIAAIFIYMQHRKTILADYCAMTQREASFLDSLGHIIDGFKEIRINRRKNDALFEAFSDITHETMDLKIRVNLRFILDVMFSQVFFYTLIAVIIFLLPRLIPTYSDVVVKVTASILFIIGPLEMIVNTSPMIARSNVALEQMYNLEAQLDASLDRVSTKAAREPVPDFSNFRQIRMKEISFSYLAPDGTPTFTLGPLNISIERGETLFLLGGNGSGKTTMLKLLCGLYHAKAGCIEMDGKTLDGDDMAAYRELFSVIFSDFHLFDRLYGLEETDPRKVRALIHEMELDGKTQYLDGRFTNINLSTGQRKRLAMIAALLENKSICIFDEWAADQDPHFREIFYRKILKNLKTQGKTIIAVTHDDRYWSLADRVIKLDFGKPVKQTPDTAKG